MDIGVDESQRVWFSPQYEDLVYSVSQGIMSSAEADTNLFRYADSKHTKILEEKVIFKNVPFEVEILKGERYIVLHRRNRWIWQEVKEEVDRMVIEEKKQELQITRSP